MPKDEDSDKRVSRRAFARGVVTAAAGAVVLPSRSEANLCGLPAISVPCGFKNNLPIGIQFVGRVLEDASVIAAAHAFQQRTEWHKKVPPVG